MILSFGRHAGMDAQAVKQPIGMSVNDRMVALIGLVADSRDRAAFLRIYRYFAPRVKSLLINRGLSRHSADDVLQEVMLGVWEKAHLYKPDKASVSSWIFTIARYKHIDRIRRVGRKEGKELELEEHHYPIAEDRIVDNEVLQCQQQNSVQDALSRLPAEQRSVIFLSFSQGLAHSEIAERLGLPLGTVKSRIRRAFQRLRLDLRELT